jgi:hypothetical protein
LSTSTSTAAPGPGNPVDPAAKKKLVANELAKLTATALNNGAVAAMITSVVGPAASDLYGIATPKSPYWWVFGLAWFTIAVGLHLAARTALGELEP